MPTVSNSVVDELTWHRTVLAIEAAMKEDIIAELTAAAAQSHDDPASLRE
jgi:hypothetical protein